MGVVKGTAKAYQWIAAALAIAALLFVYLRPLTVAFAMRDLYLRAIGMRSSFVRVGPHHIHYFDSGGDGPPLVMVHGVASRAADAAPLYRALSRTHRVYALDLLGYGDSDRPRDSDYSVRTQAAVVRGFMDALGIAQADLIGVSMGGWVALMVAAEEPRRVRSLVLVSSAGVAFPTTLHTSSFSPRNLEELRASIALQTDRRIPEFILRDLLRRSRGKAWVVRRSMSSMLTRRDLLDGRLSRVRMPVLLVWGTRDRIVPVSVAAALQRELPHARLVRLEGCGHLAIIECRAAALQAIRLELRRP
ncbi:MAG TPA: alpha/beta fold hydrolase [Thermoanaerobaculia bacterium]